LLLLFFYLFIIIFHAAPVMDDLFVVARPAAYIAENSASIFRNIGTFFPANQTAITININNYL